MLTAINDRLKKAIEEAGGEVRKLGVFEDIELIAAENAAFGIDPPGKALSGRSATVDLCHIAHRAIDGLRRWDRIHRPPKGRPRSYSTSLSVTISSLCNHDAHRHD